MSYLIRAGAGANPPTQPHCQPGFVPAWTWMPPLVNGQPVPTGQPLPQPSASTYIVVPGVTYRAIVGVFGAAAKAFANAGEVASQATAQGFTQVQAWASPQDAGFPSDWSSPATAASIGTSDAIYYVQGVYSGPSQTNLPAYKSKLLDTQGAQVWEAFSWSCQGAGVTPPTPVVATPNGGGASKLAVVATSLIAAAAVGGLVLELWRHYKTSRRVAA